MIKRVFLFCALFSVAAQYADIVSFDYKGKRYIGSVLPTDVITTKPINLNTELRLIVNGNPGSWDSVTVIR